MSSNFNEENNRLSNNLIYIFEKISSEYPDKIAFFYKDIHISYAELNKKSNQLAHVIAKSNIKSGSRIGVYLDRNSEMIIVAFLAILKSGNTYVPMDTSLSVELTEDIILDSKMPCILTNSLSSNKIEKLFSPYNLTPLFLDKINNQILIESSDNCHHSNPNHIVYVLYTSGSTGKPKGVQITEKSLMNLIEWMKKEIRFTSKDVMLGITPFTFDLSVPDIYLPLLTGGSLVLAATNARFSPNHIKRYISQYHVTLMQATPTTWQMMVDSGWKNKSKIKIITGGEALSISLGRKLIHISKDVWNLYGPTETTVWSTYYKLKSLDENYPVVSIGRAIANTQTYILNKKLKPQPSGEPGELYISGDGVSVGYLNRSRLNKNCFIPNPFSTDKNSRLYKTGDLVIEDKKGNLHYLGRIDTQIKIRGHRIEAGAIENVLIEYKGIKDAVVLDKTPEQHLELVAYLIINEENISLKALQEYLKTRVPRYMVPTKFVIVDKFPLTSNGKIDRKNIPNINEFRYLSYEKGNVSLENKYEEILIDLIESFLQRDDIDPESNFFDLGLHSILLVNIGQALNRILSQPISVVDLFEHPTVRDFANFLMKSHHIEYEKVTQFEKNSEILANLHHTLHENHIAVIGMACKVPGAENYKSFWDLIVQKKENIHFFSHKELEKSGISAELFSRDEYVPARGILSDIDKFDAEFFGYTPAEARIMDPQHRVFLEQSWTALEDAGYVADTFSGKIGIYAGMNDSTYLTNHLLTNPTIKANYDTQQLSLATSTHYLSTKVAYALGLKGPSITLNTACSTGLVSIAMACNALINNDCDMALAGAVTIITPQKNGYLYQELGILSPNGQCRVFDANSQGTVLSNGCGVVVLKRLIDALKDNDNILGVVRGWALNNDGNSKIGFTAPSIEGQVNCVKEALLKAEVAPTEVEYIEAHGTGTLLGDPIEIKSLSKAYEYETHQRAQYCALGSVKANIGHTDSASGAIGFIKTILALHHKILPPQINYTENNPNIDFQHSPYYVNQHSHAWETTHNKRTAAVHSLGFGGTNAHVIIQEAPHIKTTNSKKVNLLVVSAKTQKSLESMLGALGEFISNSIKKESINTSLADLIYTLQVGRKAFPWRAAIVYQNYEHLINILSNQNQLKQYAINCKDKKAKRVIFGFTGQGSQYAKMAYDIYQEHPYFKQIIDECCIQIQADINIDLRIFLFPKTREETSFANEKLRETQYTQPALFIVEYALAKFLISFGIKPDAMIGHSLGEYVAATIAGVLSLKDALKLVILRAQLMANSEPGAMLTVPLSTKEIEGFLNNDVEIVVHNAPKLCVVAGTKDKIELFKNRIQDLLNSKDLSCRLLNTSHAFHSKLMDPILEKFYDLSLQYALSEPHIPYISNVTGNWITKKDLTNKRYWSEHLRHTVLFSKGIETLNLTKDDVFIEIGPGQVLTQLIQQHALSSKPLLLHTLKPHNLSDQNSYEYFLETLGKLWLYNFFIDWDHLYTNEIRQRCSIPTYQFDKKSYWVGNDIDINNSHEQENHDSFKELDEKHNSPIMEQLTTIWRTVLGLDSIGLDDDFYDLGGHSLLAVSLLSKINYHFKIKIPSTTLFKVKTIRGLATIIESYEQEHEKYSPLVILRQGDTSKPPLFLVHPVGGTVFCYMQLANILDTDKTIYGFQDPSIEAEKSLFANIEEMATFYLEHIQKIQAHGPYYLCGASFGSLVVTEIAHRLEQQNEAINFIGAIDGWGKHGQETFDADFVRKIIHLHHPEYHQHSDFDKQSLWESLLHQRLNIMVKYQYQHLKSPFILFKAEDLLPEFQHNDAADNHWTTYTSSLSVINISGDHNTMLQSPNVEMLAEEMSQYLK